MCRYSFVIEMNVVIRIARFKNFRVTKYLNYWNSSLEITAFDYYFILIYFYDIFHFFCIIAEPRLYFCL